VGGAGFAGVAARAEMAVLLQPPSGLEQLRRTRHALPALCTSATGVLRGRRRGSAPLLLILAVLAVGPDARCSFSLLASRRSMLSASASAAAAAAGLLSGSAAAPAPALAEGVKALVTWTDGFSDVLIGPDMFVEDAEDGDNRISDQMNFFNPPVLDYVKRVVAKAEKASGFRLFFISPPPGLKDSQERRQYVSGMRQASGAGSDANQVVLVADPGGREPLQGLVGFAAKAQMPSLQAYVASVARTFGAEPDGAAAALAALENVAACLIESGGGKKDCGVAAFPEERVHAALGEPRPS